MPVRRRVDAREIIWKTNCKSLPTFKSVSWLAKSYLVGRNWGRAPWQPPGRFQPHGQQKWRPAPRPRFLSWRAPSCRETTQRAALKSRQAAKTQPRSRRLKENVFSTMWLCVRADLWRCIEADTPFLNLAPLWPSLGWITQPAPLGDDITPPLVLLSQIQILILQMERSHNQAKP